MSGTTSKTIGLRVIAPQLREEALAVAAITPGQLLERTSADKFQRHSVPGGLHGRLIALEDELQGKGITTDYAVGARVQAKVFVPGEKANMLLADGEDVAIGDVAASNGNGDVRAAVADSSGLVLEEDIVGFFRVALDLSDSSGADPASRRVVVEIK